MKTATDRRATRRLDRVAVYGEVVSVINDRRCNGRRVSDRLQGLTGQPALASRRGRRSVDSVVTAPTASVRSW